MIKIAVCDDEIKIGADLERTLMEIFDALKIKNEVDVYFGAREFISHLENGARYDLIFLDIEFAKDEINGVDVGRFIRETHENNIVSIVFISWEKKYAMELFEIRPLNFLVKPLEHEKIEHTVKTFVKINGLISGDFYYKKGHTSFKVRLKDIVFLENNERKIILHLACGKKEEFYGSLKETYHEQLQTTDFLFIHASYVVNYDYVIAVKYSELTLTDGTVLSISPNRRNDVRTAYASILKRRRV
ncbi:MAG: LytTR family DNA-binding domain-containing protein [Defluviitaleaceae bacterium]|nr:LytTR family DNA-binding domain-containing protein [Defluviitaleaceae bacterium]